MNPKDNSTYFGGIYKAASAQQNLKYGVIMRQWNVQSENSA